MIQRLNLYWDQKMSKQKQNNWDLNLVSRQGEDGIWRFKDGKLDGSHYKLDSEGYLMDVTPEPANRCVEDSLTHEEFIENQAHKEDRRQREKYGESDRDIEDRSIRVREEDNKYG